MWEEIGVTSYTIKSFRYFHGPPQSVHIRTFPMSFYIGTQSLSNFLLKIIIIKGIFLSSDLSHPEMQKSRKTEFFRLAHSIFNIITALFPPLHTKWFIFLHAPILNSHIKVGFTGHSTIMGPQYENCFLSSLQRMECGPLRYIYENVVKYWLYLRILLKFKWTFFYNRYFIKIYTLSFRDNLIKE